MRNTAYFFVVAISVILALIYGQDLIIPFIMGLLFWFMMRSLKSIFDRIHFVKTRFPSWLKTIISSGMMLVFLVGLFDLLSNNIAELSQSYQKYQSNITTVITRINEQFNLNIIEAAQKQMGDFDFGNLLTSLFSSLSDLIGNTFMIILYALFILLEESNFLPKLQAIIGDKTNYEEFITILEQIENSIAEYFKLKTFVSLITGVLSYIALLIIGVDSPEFWAFLIFILNFIPTIGSLVGTIFPATFALLQFGELSPFFIILIVVGLIQVFVGNILEPRLMGSSMNISPLVTILALSIWGAIWGIVGMILSVPITVIMIIVFSHFEKTRAIAILFSEKGEINKAE